MEMEMTIQYTVYSACVDISRRLLQNKFLFQNNSEFKTGK